jgi:hypothetical protein
MLFLGPNANLIKMPSKIERVLKRIRLKNSKILNPDDLP